MKLYKTTDFSKFKFYSENREVSDSHVEELKRSINTKNLLRFVPILVDKQYRVIDGQHRLKAASELKTPIYYVFVDGGSIADVILLNANNKKWGTTDYLEMYCKLGYKDYLTLRDFSKEFGLSVYLSMFLLTNPMNSPRGVYKVVSLPFKKGEFKIVDLEEARLVARYVNQTRDYCEDGAFRSREFVIALTTVIKKGLYDQFLANLKESNIKIFRSTSRLAYLRQMEIILNRRTTGPGQRYVKLF